MAFLRTSPHYRFQENEAPKAGSVILLVNEIANILVGQLKMLFIPAVNDEQPSFFFQGALLGVFWPVCSWFESLCLGTHLKMTLKDQLFKPGSSSCFLFREEFHWAMNSSVEWYWYRYGVKPDPPKEENINRWDGGPMVWPPRQRGRSRRIFPPLRRRGKLGGGGHSPGTRPGSWLWV